MSRIVARSAAVQGAVRRYYGQQRSSQIIRAPLPPPPIVVPVAFAIVETSHYHLPAKHDDPVALATEGAFAVLVLVVVAVGFWTSVRVVRRPLP